MTKFKKFLSVVLCITLFCCIGVQTFAIGEQTTTVKVSSVTAMPGESVVIDISIDNNPGIMAMAFCIVYDSDALVFDEADPDAFKRGYITNHTIKNHADKGHISFVNVESKDKTDNGKIMSITFKVKTDAKPGKHPIVIANSNREKYGNKLHNIFSDSKQNFIVPASVSGGVTVMETCENSGHKYGGWNIINQNSCTVDGIKNRTCLRCQNTEEVVIPAACDFEQEWTVDKVATPEEDGIMSRHCKNCDNVTDKITFSYEEIGGDDNDNTDDTSSNDPTSSDTSDKDNSSDDTSDDDVSGDVNSNNTSSNSSSDTGSANKNPDTSSQKENSSSDSSDDNQTNKKPVINNVAGEKVPLKEVEKLEDYQQNIKPNLKNEDTSNSDDVSTDTTSSEAASEPTTSSKTEFVNSDVTTGAITQNEEPSFWATSTGIIMIIVCSLLSLGIVALGVILIIRNKKSQNIE